MPDFHWICDGPAGSIIQIGPLAACPSSRHLVKSDPTAGGSDDMAADTHSDNDMKAHVGSYGRFIFMMKWGTALSLLVGLIVILIIRN
ncbi:MAG TPA: hypothetical protein VIT38_14135 [Allosphingosinicella sp.]